ncbi:MAG: efflux RND transporter periplasmic adaptor subunit [Deltaproteobacteria bacterium]|nr:efflux RND transporter periplasmic adaptor subunit [Deltaproteobacteria bacterium]
MSFLVLTLAACPRPGGPEPHGHGHEESAEPEAPPVAITRWTGRHELFVEFPSPVAAQPMRFHAHVTRLEGTQAATRGVFRVLFRRGDTVVAQASAAGVTRPGVFKPETTAPAAGDYQVAMVYDVEGVTDTFECGTVTVHATPPGPKEEAPGGAAITFLKETQWRIPFATAVAEERPLAVEREFAAVVDAAGSSQLTINAPVAGRVLFPSSGSLVVGTRVSAGATLATLVPLLFGDDLARLQASIAELRVTQAQQEREVKRLGDLVQQGLRTNQDVVEAANHLETTQVRLRTAEERLTRVLATGQRDGVAVRSPLDALVSQVHVGNGDTVQAGMPILRVADVQRLWLTMRSIARPLAETADALPVAVRFANGSLVDLAAYAPRLLSVHPVTDPESRIATWTVELARGSTSPLLALGSSVVVVMRMDQPANVVAVPRTAVVELNTRPWVFVQVEGETFEKRGVVTGRSDGTWVQIVSGVAAGERVVTRGGFDIHLSSLMGTMESHRH